MDINEHKRACLQYGFLDIELDESSMKAIADAGLDEQAAYGIECDLQCGWFESFDDALQFYAAGWGFLNRKETEDED